MLTVLVVLLISLSVASSHQRGILIPPSDCPKSTTGAQYSSKIEYLTDGRMKLLLYGSICCEGGQLPDCDDDSHSIVGMEKICRRESTENTDVLSFNDCTTTVINTAPLTFIEIQAVDRILIYISTIPYSRKTEKDYVLVLYIAFCDHVDTCVIAIKRYPRYLSYFTNGNTFDIVTRENVTNIDHVVIIAISHENPLTNNNNTLFQIGMLNMTRVGVKGDMDILVLQICGEPCNVTDTPLVVNARKCRETEKSTGIYHFRKGTCKPCECTNKYSKCNPSTGEECYSTVCPEIASETYPGFFFKQTLNGTHSEIKCYTGTLTRDCISVRFEAVWGEERNNSCLSANDVHKEISSSKDITSTTKKQRKAIYCDKTSSEKYPKLAYNKTMIGDISEIKCHKGTLTRECQTRGGKLEWGIEKDNNCLSEVDVLKKIENKSKRGKNFTREDMEYFVESLVDIVEVAKTNPTIALNILSTVGSLMAMDTKTWKQVDESGLKSDQVKRAIEKLLSVIEIPNNRNSSVVSTEDINLGVYEITQIRKPITVNVTFKAHNNTTMTTRHYGPRVTISNYLLRKWAEERNTRFQIVAYRNSKLFIDARSDNRPRDQSVVSVIVDKITTFATQEAVLTYEIPVRDNKSVSLKCVYWNSVERLWSTNGINQTTDENGERICRSSHLSSFSILLDTDANKRLPEKHEQYLTYMSYIGCSLSIVGLVITIIIYSLFKSLHGDDSGKILINICVSMLMLNVVFLIGSLDSESYDLGICMAVGVTLHYFLLSSLLWMMIEALHMYEMLIVVFRRRRRWFMKIRMLAGWGLPLAVVGITLAISTNSYKPSNQFCFLSQTNQLAFYAAVLAPSCIILLVNSYIFIRISILIIKSKNSIRGSASIVSITQVRGAMSVMFILGVTWVLGPLAIGPAKVVFAYIFTILNSSQGFLVCIFRCVFNTETVRAVKLYTTTGRFKERRGTLSTQTYTTKTMVKNTKKDTSTFTGESADIDLSYVSESPSSVIPDGSDGLAFKPDQTKL